MKKLVISLVVIASLILPFPSSIFAYQGGLLEGKTLQVGANINTPLSETDVVTDGNEETFYELGPSTTELNVEDHVFYVFKSNHRITGYQLKGEPITGGASDYWSIAYYNAAGNLIGGDTINARHDGVKVNRAAVDNVRIISVHPYDRNNKRKLYEFDVFGLDPYPPTTPTGVVADAGDGYITIHWNEHQESDVIGYHIYRENQKLNEQLITDHFYQDKDLINGVTYTYRVSAVDSSENESGRSTPISAVPGLPPDVPTGLKINPGDRELQITWDSNHEHNIVGYNIYRNGVKINVIPIDKNSHIDQGLINFEIYQYQISAVNTYNKESELSDIVVGMPEDPDVTPPDVPVALSGSPGDGEAILTWTANFENDLAGYNLYRDGVKVNSSLITTTEYTDTGLQNKTAYTYEITAVDSSGNESTKSAAVTVVPIQSPIPKNLTTRTGDRRIIVNWQTVDDATEYNVYRNGELVATVTNPPYYDTAADQGVTYIYYVTSLLNGEESERSNTAEGIYGQVIEYPAEHTTLPGVGNLITTAWNFIKRFNIIIILILSLLFVPVIIGFIHWLITQTNQKRANAELYRIMRDGRGDDQQRILERLAEQDRRHIEEIKKMRESPISDREREKRMKEITKEQRRLTVQVVREHRESRKSRESGGVREMRSQRPGRGVRDGRR